MGKLTGIYKITNKLNNKIYVGSGIDIKNRWNLHKFKLKNNKHHSIKLQRSYNKHGIDHFIFEVLEYCSKDVLIEREQYWIDTLNSYNKGYNCNPIAGSCLGSKRTQKTKNKISKAKLGLKRDEITKKKISETMKGKNSGRPSWNSGKKISKEHKEKISKSLSGSKNPNYGKKLSEETIKKMSEAKKGTNNPMYKKSKQIKS